MITDKISKLGVAFAMLGLGLLAACGESNVASSYSETQTGKPVVQLGRLADLDTSIVYQRIDVVDPCSAKTVALDALANTLGSSTSKATVFAEHGSTTSIRW